MRLSTIFSEAARNITTGTTRAAVFATLLGVIVGSLLLADTLALRALHDDATTFVESGAAIRVMHTENAIQGADCDALSGHATVYASGALATADPIELTALPSTSIPAFRATPGMLRLLGANDVRTGAWLSERLAEPLGATPGVTLDTPLGELTVAGIFPYPDDGRDSRLGNAILLPTIAQDIYDECWASAWPLSEETDVLLRFTAASTTNNAAALQVGQLNKNHGSTFNGEERFDARITRFAYPLIAVIGAGLGWVSIRTRRLEHAAALHAGQHRPEQLLTILIESSTWAVLGASLAALITLTGALSTGTALPLLPVAVPGVPIAIGGVLLGATAASSLTRERHLFRYFKERS